MVQSLKCSNRVGDMNIPVQMLLLALAGWINEQQLAIIEYLQEENRVL